MKTFLQQCRRACVAVVASACLLVSASVWANGEIGEHVNELSAHVKQYNQEVEWLVSKVGTMVDIYTAKGADSVNTNELIEHWEAVDFHAAIETHYVPVYAKIWQGLFGVKQAIDNKQSATQVRAQEKQLQQALWQALGAVKLAAQYQQKGVLAAVSTTNTGTLTESETIDEIKHRLDRVVAKYAEKLGEAATNIVHDTYLHLFEGVEGTLIAKDATLVESLEKDFNVTLPQAIEADGGVDNVRAVVDTMHSKLDRAKKLLREAEQKRKDVF